MNRRYTANGSFDATSFTAGVTAAINVAEIDVLTIQLDAFATDTFGVEASVGKDIFHDLKISPQTTVGVDVLSTTSEGIYQADVSNMHEIRFTLSGSSSPAWTGQWAGVSRS